MARCASAFQLASIAVRSMVRMPPASAAGGPAVVTFSIGGSSGSMDSAADMGPVLACFQAAITPPSQTALADPVGQPFLFGQRRELGDRAFKRELDRAGRSVALLADD